VSASRQLGVNNLLRVVTQPRLAVDRTRDLLIASPTPYCCATTPRGRQLVHYNYSSTNCRHLSLDVSARCAVVCSEERRRSGPPDSDGLLPELRPSTDRHNNNVWTFDVDAASSDADRRPPSLDGLLAVATASTTVCLIRR